MKNIVYVGLSLDGYITDRDHGLDWLEMVPNPDGLDFGWSDFLQSIDCLIMGRKTFEIISNFNCSWPYNKPVLVLTNSLNIIDPQYDGKVELINGDLKTILKMLHKRGFEKNYIDGGTVVKNFLKEDLIDEMILTTIPILLGGGISLFGELPKEQKFAHLKTEIFLDQLVQSHYKRVR